MPDELKYHVLARCPFGHPVDLTIVFRKNPTLIGFEPAECEVCELQRGRPEKKRNRFSQWLHDRKMDKELKKMMEGG